LSVHQDNILIIIDASTAQALPTDGQVARIDDVRIAKGKIRDIGRETCWMEEC
jgi:hypothetical protein